VFGGFRPKSEKTPNTKEKYHAAAGQWAKRLYRDVISSVREIALAAGVAYHGSGTVYDEEVWNKRLGR
jgi:hypothetical protein